MNLKLTIKPDSVRDALPDDRTLAEAAGRGVSNAIKRHLVRRDALGRGDGLPRTGYWGDAAGGVTTEVTDAHAVVTIHKEGAALHYYGGVVYPVDARALAIPQVARAAGKRPGEFDPGRDKLALVWPKGSTTGTLRDRETGEVVYLLVSHATIKADETVLPTEEELRDAAFDAMEAVL